MDVKAFNFAMWIWVFKDYLGQYRNRLLHYGDVVVIIDARDAIKSLTHADQPQGIPLLTWHDAWSYTTGKGIAIGLLEGPLSLSHPDFTGAEVHVEYFAGEARSEGHPAAGHAVHSALLLVGQGRSVIRGLAPSARLLVASVIGPDNIASEPTVAAAIEWLISVGADVIAIPLGGPVKEVNQAIITDQIERAMSLNIAVFAAAGNVHPDPLLFPACHKAVIAVGAVNNRAWLLPSCARWPRLDLAAPGFHPTEAGLTPSVVPSGGTSIACIFAVGAAALAASMRTVPVGCSTGPPRLGGLRALRTE